MAYNKPQSLPTGQCDADSLSLMLSRVHLLAATGFLTMTEVAITNLWQTASPFSTTATQVDPDATLTYSLNTI